MEHVLTAARGAVAALRGKSLRDLDMANDFTLALIKRIEMIGEAASRVRPETRQQFEEVPWRDIVDTRHRLIHGYSEVDLVIVWKIATEELAPLIVSLERVLANP